MKPPPINALVQQNLLDKLITWVDPKAGARRLAARGALALAGGYTGAKIDRAALKAWNPPSGSPATDIIPDLPRLRSLTRDAVRNAPVATGAVANSVDAIVGTGLACNPAINHKLLGVSEEFASEWQDTTRTRFEAWAESTDSDITGRCDFYGNQDLSLRSSFESGDCWVLTPMVESPMGGMQLALQLIEADRVSNPTGKSDSETLQDGVVVDEATGASVGIWVAKRHPGDRRWSNSWTYYPIRGAETGRRNALQIWQPLRPMQVRGVPWLAPIIEPLKQLTRWTDNELNAAVTSSLFSLFVKMDPDAFEGLFEQDAQEALVENASNWTGEMESGKAVRLLPGEEIQSAAMNRPNPDFDPFWIAMVRQIGMAISIPYEVLVMHFQSSYSAARGALLMAWRFYRKRRDMLAKQLCQPVYELWLANEVAEGRIAAPGFFADPLVRAAWCKAVWTGDGPGSIDPGKEVDAAVKRIDAGISTVQAESLLHDGGDWQAKNQQRGREIKAQKEAGVYRAPTSVTPVPPTPRQDDDESVRPGQNN